MYLGSGLFNNFWKREAPYTLTDKCLEIYHWRHGLYEDAEANNASMKRKWHDMWRSQRLMLAEAAHIVGLMGPTARRAAFTRLQVAASTQHVNSPAGCIREPPTWALRHTDAPMTHRLTHIDATKTVASHLNRIDHFTAYGCTCV